MLVPAFKAVSEKPYFCAVPVISTVIKYVVLGIGTNDEVTGLCGVTVAPICNPITLDPSSVLVPWHPLPLAHVALLVGSPAFPGGARALLVYTLVVKPSRIRKTAIAVAE